MQSIARHTGRLVAGALLLATAGVAGCSADAGRGPDIPGTLPTTVEDASPTAGPTAVPRPGPASTPTGPSPTGPTGPTATATSPAPDVTVTGTVTEGVESGCLVLTTDDATTYLLLGGDDELRAGARVAVQGTVAPDLATTCQQGIPLQVAAVTAP